ncbi:MAG: C40 family peptidase [Endomicrobiales bacterium]|nr:C40 family peptidase [Endomicrobiales bacterium]
MFIQVLISLAVFSAAAEAAYVLCLGEYPKQQAEYLHRDLSERGYPVYLLYGENCEVRMGNYETLDRAQAIADKLKSEERIVARIREEEAFDQYQFSYDGTESGREVNESAGEDYADPRAKRIISLALGLFGQPYKYGGTRIGKGIDCSYFCQTIFRELGIELPRTSGLQFKVGKKIEKGELKTGDLVFFHKRYYSKRNKAQKRQLYRKINHVGIYLGNGEFIHATVNAKRVTISKMSERYFVKHYSGARRVLED